VNITGIPLKNWLSYLRQAWPGSARHCREKKEKKRLPSDLGYKELEIGRPGEDKSRDKKQYPRGYGHPGDIPLKPHAKRHALPYPQR